MTTATNRRTFARRHAQRAVKTVLVRFPLIAGIFATLALYVWARLDRPDFAAAFFAGIAAALLAVECVAPNRRKQPALVGRRKATAALAAFTPALLFVALPFGLDHPAAAIAAALGIAWAVWMNETTDW
ncbi:conserved membrane hypothetical protein [Burkholderia gladioli]|uniref:hypothetical protein n=1 Tax=Burkholderia gladioli TaxID=28095 RepID=UPI001CAADED1|nr:hypothetical protein [Burkholderia gladioli]CAG9236065.1 conserved membrane hypothetical protein [Burkholderia gladioli]